MSDVEAGVRPRIIDLCWLGHRGVIAAFLLRSPAEAALIETGPGSTVPTLLAALDEAGVAPDEVRHLLVTHVHLDHSGAAGLLARRFPNATVYAHEAGVPHLLDPSKLVASAARIYGAEMQRFWGEVLPVPPDRLLALRDGQRLRVAGRTLEALATPGHAKHHVAFRDLESNEIYTGDVAGVRMEGHQYVRPPTPPPDLDLEAWEASLTRLELLEPAAFYITHFGRSEGTARHLATLRRQLREWERLVLDTMRAGEDAEAITEALRRHCEAEMAPWSDQEIRTRYAMASGYAMNVAGYERYLRKRYPELSEPERR